MALFSHTCTPTTWVAIPALLLFISLQAPAVVGATGCSLDSGVEVDLVGADHCLTASGTGVQDESGLMQLSLRVRSLRKSSGESAPPKTHVGSLKEWSDHLVFGKVIPSVAAHLPFKTTNGTGISDGGAGMPVNALACLLGGILAVWLFLWKASEKFGGLGSSGASDGIAVTERHVEMRWYHVLLLVQLDMMAPVTQDAYIPSMPLMAQELNTTESAVGLSLQINWVLSGFIALALGIASDKYGRRPALVSALVCYIIGALLAAVSQNVGVLIVARCIQGIGGGSQALCYAVACDIIPDEEERARFNNMLSLYGSLAIVIAPVAGGLAATLMGWRMVFILLACWGMLALWNVFRLLPETSRTATRAAEDEAPRPDEGVFGPLLGVFAQSLRPLGLIASMWMLFGALFAILSSMSFVLDDVYSQDTRGIFVFMAVLAVSALAGCLACFLLLRVRSSWQVLRFGMTWLLVVGAFFLMMGVVQVQLSLYGFVAFVAAYIFGLNVLMGPLRSLLAEPFGGSAGAANGLAMLFADPSGAVLGFTFTWALETSGLFRWMMALGLTAALHQAIFWAFCGLRPEEDQVFASRTGCAK